MRDKIADYEFSASQLPDGSEEIKLYKKNVLGIFRKAASEEISVSQWPKFAPLIGQSALATAISRDNFDDIIENDDSFVLPSKIVASLSESEADALGLPPVTSLTLQLTSSGSLAKGTISVEAKWVRRGGAPVRAEMTGARLRDGELISRLVEPLYSTYHATIRVNESKNEDTKRAAFAELRLALGEENNHNISTDGFIERIRIACAANFSLDVKTTAGRFDFDPILFARHSEENNEGELLDQEESSLLTPSDNTHFQRKFRNHKGEKKSFLMPDGTILFLDSLLNDSLKIVAKKQLASAEEKREFLKTPQRILREELNLDAIDNDELADHLFIETRQFSERVSGIDVWQTPVLPWIKPKPNSWLPESYGLQIGTPPDARHVEIKPGEAEPLLAAMKQALLDGKSTIPWKGEEIPVSNAGLKPVEGIVELEKAVSASTENSQEPADSIEPVKTYFLKVGQNFEQLEYEKIPHSAKQHEEFTIPNLPTEVVSSPEPHQIKAFEWLTEAWSKKIPGVLLADDMGLGKTFQSLLFLLWLRKNSSREKPILIVAPTGLLRNWQAEIRKHFAPNAFGVVVEAFGKSLARQRIGHGSDIRGGTSRLNIENWEKAGIVLTTYETMRDYHMSFARIRFSASVYDEIQKLKNPTSQMARAAKSINADIQIGMTGTPVENRLQDIWSITDTIYPGFLGTSKDFETAYASADANKLKELQVHLTENSGWFPPYMLRRMKHEILEGLPEKKAQKYSVSMPEEQLNAYNSVLARASAMLETGEKGAMLKVLHMLRGTSLHPIEPRGIDDFAEYISQSARLKKTFDLLETIKSKKEKALVFCEDLEMQSFLSMAIQQHFSLPKRPILINGKVAGIKRQKLVDEFQQDRHNFDVMILSPKAGGVGLNITSANHVIHLSRWWNPAVEDQATDRVYRIGQEKPVTVHIPMAIHPNPAIAEFSFDKRLDHLMERKRSLSAGLLMPPENDNDIEEMLSSVLELGNTLPSDDEIAIDEKQSLISPKKAPTSTVAAPDSKKPLTLEKKSPNDESQLENIKIEKKPSYRVKYQPNQARDFTVFEHYLKDAHIVELRIMDPYCCSDEKTRNLLEDFILKCLNLSKKIDYIHLKFLDAESMNSYHSETTLHQYDDIKRRLKRHFKNTKLAIVAHSKRQKGEFHDREIIAKFKNNDSVSWDLGRGIDGVMNLKRECSVTAIYHKS